MKNIKTVRGILRQVQREPGSKNGNPRYSVMINEIVYKTGVDEPLGYKIPDYFDKAVEAIVGEHYGINIIKRVKVMA